MPSINISPINKSSIWPLAFRWVVVSCQGATLLITWPLCQVHLSPPMLPALPLPPVDLGLALLFSLVFILIRPLPGIITHTILIIYSVLIDQTRLQPEIVSLVFLLWGTLPNPNARMVARAHLVSLWVFAGINKILSPKFLNSTAQWILIGLISHPPSWLHVGIGYFIALTEFSVGVLALIPRTRILASILALGLHAGIILALSPIGHNWNESVWPWNIALALSGFALIAPWKEPPLQSIRYCHTVIQALIVLLLLAPLGFYVGITDAYLAHNLYSSNTPRAITTSLSPEATWRAFNVPLPPEHRLFEQYFRLTCRPGDSMQIVDPRLWFRLRGLGTRDLMCPSPP